MPVAVTFKAYVSYAKAVIAISLMSDFLKKNITVHLL